MTCYNDVHLCGNLNVHLNDNDKTFLLNIVVIYLHICKNYLQMFLASYPIRIYKPLFHGGDPLHIYNKVEAGTCNNVLKQCRPTCRTHQICHFALLNYHATLVESPWMTKVKNPAYIIEVCHMKYKWTPRSSSSQFNLPVLTVTLDNISFHQSRTGTKTWSKFTLERS